jgi:hypothetical protein
VYQRKITLRITSMTTNMVAPTSRAASVTTAETPTPFRFRVITPTRALTAIRASVTRTRAPAIARRIAATAAARMTMASGTSPLITSPDVGRGLEAQMSIIAGSTIALTTIARATTARIRRVRAPLPSMSRIIIPITAITAGIRRVRAPLPSMSRTIIPITAITAGIRRARAQLPGMGRIITLITTITAGIRRVRAPLGIITSMGRIITLGIIASRITGATTSIITEKNMTLLRVTVATLILERQPGLGAILKCKSLAILYQI